MLYYFHQFGRIQMHSYGACAYSQPAPVRLIQPVGILKLNQAEVLINT